MDKSIVGNDVPYFPEGIISEILSYLEVKSLLRCKSVCKLWYSTIKEDEFVKMHMKRNEGRFHCFERKRESLNSDGIMETVQYLSSVNGLLLEKRKSSATSPATYRISNPSTKEILNVPNPNMISHFMAISFHSSTGLYNLFSLSADIGHANLFVEVLDLGCPTTDPCNCEDLSWRTLNIKEIKNIDEHQEYGGVIVLSGKGMLYVYKARMVGLGKPEIICVDLVQKTGMTCIAPESIIHDRDRVNFQLWHGKPTILSLVKEQLSVWVLEDYKEHKWSDKIVISFPCLNGYPIPKRCRPLIFDLDGEDVLICRYPSARFVYNIKSKVMSTVTPSTTRPLKDIKVAETLVSLKGMRPEKK